MIRELVRTVRSVVHDNIFSLVTSDYPQILEDNLIDFDVAVDDDMTPNILQVFKNVVQGPIVLDSIHKHIAGHDGAIPEFVFQNLQLIFIVAARHAFTNTDVLI